MNCNVVYFIQARTGSSRLPNKVLKNFYREKSILTSIISRIHRQSSSPVVVLTSDLPSDDGIEEAANLEGAHCLRGSEENVLSRFLEGITTFSPNYIVRVTSDNPFFDASMVCAVKYLMDALDADYASTKLGNGFPVGADLEVFKAESLVRCSKGKLGSSQNHREHVTSIFYDERSDSSNLAISRREDSLTKVVLTVDTEEQFLFAASIANRLGDSYLDSSWRQAASASLSLATRTPFH